MGPSYNQYTNRIRDTVHGFIRLSDAEVEFIDSPEFQRLRRIKQLAMTSYVYPGAVHTRFEHSLGVLELATQMFSFIKRNTDPRIWEGMVVSRLNEAGLDEEQSLIVLRLAALFHDIGHLPFSHAAEGILPKGIKHEHISVAIMRSMKQRVDKLFFEGATERAIQLIDPVAAKSPTEIMFLRGLLSGQIDADRCDYLLRDSLHCGVNYGRFDLERLLDSIMIVDNDGIPDVAIHKGGLHAVEALILARYYMFSQVYYHRTRRLFDHYLTEFLKEVFLSFEENNLINVLDWDDDAVFNLVRKYVSGEKPLLRKYATQLWFRGGNIGKHSTVYETNEFAGVQWVKAIRAKVDKLRAELPGYELFADYNYDKPAVIHKFYCEGDEEEGDQLMVVTGRQQNLSLITKESKVIRSMPKKFWVVRVYAMGAPDDLKKIRERFNDIREG